jgi:subtilase family serine protease
MRAWKLLLPLLASTLCFAQQPDRITGPINSSQMVALQNHISPLAQPRYELGLIDPSSPLNVTMLFTQTAAQQAELQNLLEEQQDPKSANFHKWLTPEQYAGRFGLSQNDINRVTAWLQSQGFNLVYVARGHDAITFSGNAAQVQTAFKTEIHSYDVTGKMHFANSTPPMIPAVLSGIIGGFRGLHNFFPRPQLRSHPDFSVTGTSGHFLAPGDLATIYNINPLYALSPTIDGTNQKLVVVGQTDIYLADINDYRSGFGLSTIPTSSSSCAPSAATGEVGVVTAPCDTTNFQYVVSGTGGDPGLKPGDISESDLDIEVSGSIARNAQIIFVTSSGGVGDSWSWAIDQNLAPVISISYGLCEAFNTAPPLATEDELFQKAASFGISVFAASGDSGAAVCDGDAFGDVSVATLGQSVSYPASSPEVTAVGGTEFDEGTGNYWENPPTTSTTNFGNSAKSYIPELAWNDTKAVGSLDATGGGPSNCEHASSTTTVTIGGQPYAFSVCDAPPAGGFAKPTYQTALTPSDSVRDVPDISFSASNVNDSYIVCTPQSEIPHDPDSSTSTCVSGIDDALVTYNSAFGGTSCATPLAAGMAALLNQYLGSSGLGNLNTQLYKFYGTNQSAFHNINTGTSSIDDDASTNIVPCTSGTPSSEPLALRCPSTDSIGYSVAGGASYSTVTGLGSINIDTLFTVWAASRTTTTTLISPSSPTANQGSSVTFTATVTPSATTGTVSFYDNGSTTALGTADLGSGSAVFATTALPAGSNSVVATYNGNASSNFSTSTSPAIVNVTAPFTLSATPPSSSVPAGQTASYQITITPVGGFTGSVAFTNSSSSPNFTPGSCTAGLPAGALCNFSQGSVTLNGSTPSTLTLHITTAANMALPSGPQVITVTGTSGGITETTTVGLTVTATTETFTLATQNGASTFPVAVGGTAVVAVNVSSTTGFIVNSGTAATTALPLAYTCTGSSATVTSLSAAEISCQVSPGGTQPTSAVAITVNLGTIAPTSQMRRPWDRGIFYALLLPGLFGIVFAAGSRTRGLRLLSLIVVLGFSTLWLGACGGSGGGGTTTPPNPGSTPGSYAVTINATTGGANPVASSFGFTLNVTQ